MFWCWFWDLYVTTFGPIQPCPSCHLWPSQDCGYLEKSYDHWGGGYDYNCVAPDCEDEDGNILDCDGCHHLICDRCMKLLGKELNRKQKIYRKKEKERRKFNVYSIQNLLNYHGN